MATVAPPPLPLPPMKRHNIAEEYDLDPRTSLGVGISGHVIKCVRKSDRKPFALKCLDIRPQADREISMMWLCRGSPHVVHLEEVFMNDVKLPQDYFATTRYLLVMELMHGGELFDRIASAHHFTEVQASALVRKMAAAVRYLHENGIAHRDIKPENFLFRTKEVDSDLCLGDFGFAKHDHGDLATPLYTPYYVGPEVLQAKHRGRVATYSRGCDMWSMGVIIYILLSGYPPFQARARGASLTPMMENKIMRGEFSFDAAIWGHISDQAKSVVRSLLCVNQELRMTARQLCDHPWVAGHGVVATPLRTPQVMSESPQEMKEARDFIGEQLMELRRDADIQLVDGDKLPSKAKKAAAPVSAPNPSGGFVLGGPAGPAARPAAGFALGGAPGPQPRGAGFALGGLPGLQQPAAPPASVPVPQPAESAMSVDSTATVAGMALDSLASVETLTGASSIDAS